MSNFAIGSDRSTNLNPDLFAVLAILAVLIPV